MWVQVRGFVGLKAELLEDIATLVAVSSLGDSIDWVATAKGITISDPTATADYAALSVHGGINHRADNDLSVSEGEYQELVCAAALRIRHYNHSFKIESDTGWDMEAWQLAADLYQIAFNTTPDHFQKPLG